MPAYIAFNPEKNLKHWNVIWGWVYNLVLKYVASFGTLDYQRNSAGVKQQKNAASCLRNSQRLLFAQRNSKARNNEFKILHRSLLSLITLALLERRMNCTHCNSKCQPGDLFNVKYLISRSKERHDNWPSFGVFSAKNRYQASKHSPNNFWWCTPTATKSSLKTKDSPKAVLFRKWPRPPAEVLSAQVFFLVPGKVTDTDAKING